MLSVKVAHRCGERKFRVEIVPNPLGGVNTHLWRSEAYIVGIVPHVMLFYTLSNRFKAIGRTVRLSGVISGKSKMSKTPFPKSLIRCWREVLCIYLIS